MWMNRTATKKMRIIPAILSCLLAVASLAGCAGGAVRGSGKGVFSVMKLEAKELQATVYGSPEPSLNTAANGANDFAFRLSAALLENAGDENFVCSPYSVWLPLAALVNATDAEHKDALLAALGAAGITEADVNRAASRMLYDLTKLRNKDDEYTKEYYYNPLQIANAIFVGNNVTLRKDFAQTFLDNYRGSVINVDFSSQDAVDAVNRWASENTDGLITNLIQEFNPQTVVAIANAIYFSDRWSWEFNTEQTTEDVFHAPSGESAAFYMLRKGDSQTYYEDDQVQAMPLRFKSGGGLYIILPKNGGANELLSSMTNDYFNEIQADSINASGKLLLPRFSIENEVKGLKGALETLGVPLFDEDSAPLTGGLIEEDIRVWASDAIQQAVIQVDEKGTTAAAVTVIPIAGAGMPQPTEPFEMICDRPFVFILFDRTYDGGSQILFTGVVNQP
jgi:serpin B